MTNGTTRPIFVRGLSRSGGTLMCTLLDAHPDVSMSYELYPRLLEIDGGIDLAALASRFVRCRSNRAVRGIAPTQLFGTFVLRCARSGLAPSDFGDILGRFAADGGRLDTARGRLDLVGLCGAEKMRRDGKTRWGMKCNNAYEEYLERWPEAAFLCMQRDGRDVLASQLNTGDFRKTPAEVAQGWTQTQRRFERLVADPEVRAAFVRYEALTAAPEVELPRICAFLGLAFSDAMLDHTRSELTIFRSSHLSGSRVRSAIDTKMIGRWKRDLSPAQLEEFTQAAGDDLRRFGYV